MREVSEFFRGKRIFVTGHTGFKGSWLCRILLGAGAEVFGYALPPTERSLYERAGLERVHSVFADVRDSEALAGAFRAADPQVVFHLAAQPIVRAGFRDPAYTYAVNVAGTVNLLECVRKFGGVRSFVNVTTDKVYREDGISAHGEGDALGGADPYSCSKSCSDLIARSYAQSFFADRRVRISSVRSGNTIGGGDRAPDRIFPDCVRAALAGEPIRIRNPHSLRPYHHVLEPLFAYLLVAAGQWEDASRAGEYNVGPTESVSAADLAEMFCAAWGGGQAWRAEEEKTAPREAEALRLDCSKMRRVFGWKPRWNVKKAVGMAVEWEKALLGGESIPACMDGQIEEYFSAK